MNTDVETLYLELTEGMRFVAYWGRGYAKPETLTLTLNEIESRYEELHEFFAMSVGEVLDLSDLSGTHYVLRVE